MKNLSKNSAFQVTETLKMNCFQTALKSMRRSFFRLAGRPTRSGIAPGESFGVL